MAIGFPESRPLFSLFDRFCVRRRRQPERPRVMDLSLSFHALGKCAHNDFGEPKNTYLSNRTIRDKKKVTKNHSVLTIGEGSMEK